MHEKFGTTKGFKGFHCMEYMGLEIQMRLLRSIELENYLNIKHAKLEDFKDLNIIIGPNNCGKTSLLRAVHLLSRTEFSRFADAYPFCRTCSKVFEKHGNIQNAACKIALREKYLTNTSAKVIFGYYKSGIERVLPEISERQKSILNSIDLPAFIDHLDKEFREERLVMKGQKKHN